MKLVHQCNFNASRGLQPAFPKLGKNEIQAKMKLGAKNPKFNYEQPAFPKLVEGRRMTSTPTYIAAVAYMVFKYIIEGQLQMLSHITTACHR
jgi:hypothetical protein